MPTKVFLIDRGHEAVKGYVTYGAGLILDVGRDETIDIYAVSRGNRGRHLGRFGYDKLVVTAPPRGLRIADTR